MAFDMSARSGDNDVPINPTSNDSFPVSNEELNIDPVTGKKKKVPRRLIHFANGDILEEYSTDEESDHDEVDKATVNPKTLKWVPWMWYTAAVAATRALNVADFCGEKLAWFFGITSPKYQFAINEYHRQVQERREEEQREEREKEAARQRKLREMGAAEESREEDVVSPGNVNLAYSDDMIVQNEDASKY